MRNLVAFPVIGLAVILQSSVISHITLLSGYADLPLVLLSAWALQEQVESAWHWALLTGLMVGFISAMPVVIPLIGYLVVVVFAQILQQRVWQAPLLAMFSVTFMGTLVMNIFALGVLRFTGIPLPIADSLGFSTLPSLLLNMLLAIPCYALMRDLANWVYPAPEAG